MKMISSDRLKMLFSYDPLTGEFRKIAKGLHGPRPAGSLAGSRHKFGYKKMGIDYRAYLAHDLAWLYMMGEWPLAQIDHINGKKDDNRWANLRLASQSQNLGNSKRHKDNRSGFKGVRIKASGRFDARIMVNRKEIALGTFDTAEEAHRAYANAAYRYRGEFGRAE
jgi:hypothetical protein